MNDLSFLNPQEAYSVAVALLYAIRSQPQYSTISELPYLLDYASFMKFIKYYEGQTIRIPSFEEINNVLKILLLYQYHDIEGIEWKDALLRAGFKEEESLSVKTKLQIFKKLLKAQDFGGRQYD